MVRGWLLLAAAFALLVALYVTTGRGGGIDVDGPVVANDNGWGLGGTAGMDALVGGTFTYDDGCVLLSGNVVIWPDGTTWDEEATAVVLADGTAIHVGDTVTGGGGVGAQGRERRRWLRTEAGQVLGDCLAPGAAVTSFNVESELEIDPAR